MNCNLEGMYSFQAHYQLKVAEMYLLASPVCLSTLKNLRTAKEIYKISCCENLLAYSNFG